MNNIKAKFLSIIFLIPIVVFSQQPKDLGHMTIYENHFYNQILKTLNQPYSEGRTVFKAIPSNVIIPSSPDEFEIVWKMSPISQGRTGTCWEYSTNSFYESEIFRITGNGIKLSEMYIVYYEYLSKAEEFIDTKGKSNFGEGSEANAVTRQMKKHGLVPNSAYSGNRRGTSFPDHKMMFADMETLLFSYKKRNSWDRELILEGIKVILNTYLGVPPQKFEYKGKNYSPISFMTEAAQLNPNEYIEFMSLKSEPYWTLAEYKVADNYWHSKDYHNVPLDVFMDIVRSAVKQGYSITIGGDVSESGYLPQYDAAFIPSYDIPSEYIDDNARQFRFSNRSTTDDHGIHLVGYKIGEDGKWWFLIKDSSSSSFNGNHKGYYFYHEDYVKLKMMNITVHRNVVKEILKKF